LQCKHLRRGCGGFIGSKMKRNQYRKPEPKNGRKSSRKKNQTREEGRRIFSESVEENPTEEDPVLNRPFCIHSISPLTVVIKLMNKLTGGHGYLACRRQYLILLRSRVRIPRARITGHYAQDHRDFRGGADASAQGSVVSRRSNRRGGRRGPRACSVQPMFVAPASAMGRLPADRLPPGTVGVGGSLGGPQTTASAAIYQGPSPMEVGLL